MHLRTRSTFPAEADTQNPIDLPNLCFLGSNVESGSATASNHRRGRRLADDFAPGEHARACPAPAALLAVSGHHAALLCDSDAGGEGLVYLQVRGMIPANPIIFL